MKKLFLLLVVAAMAGFTSCSKDDGNESGGDPTAKPLAIEVRTGETYTFDAAIGQVLTAPNAFYAETTQNGIKGLRDGKTSAKVVVAGTTYDCTINVKAKNTLYLDPMTLLGVDKNSILALYGDPVANEGESYLFSPLTGYGCEKGTIFNFENGVVTIAIVVVPAAYASEIGAHLADRYVLAYEEGDVMMLVNGLDMDSWTTGVLVQIDVPNISIIYASREYLESAASQQTFRRLSSLIE